MKTWNDFMSLMPRYVSIFLASGLAVLLTGCASLHYKHTQSGMLSGRLIVEWRKPDLFVFRPDAAEPLLFSRRDGRIIQPQEMSTDGGSIPRPFWAFRNFSPWGYGPAFVIHDWLFHMHHCRLPGYEKYSVEEAAMVMSEIMKTMMETPMFDYGSKTVMYLMYEAVQTAPARDAWEKGECVTPDIARLTTPPDAVFVVEVPRRER